MTAIGSGLSELAAALRSDDSGLVGRLAEILGGRDRETDRRLLHRLDRSRSR